MLGNTFSKIYAAQNLNIESKSKAMRLLVSEIDIILCNCNFGGYNGDVFSNTFSEIYAPENLYIYRVDNDSATPLSF